MRRQSGWKDTRKRGEDGLFEGDGVEVLLEEIVSDLLGDHSLRGRVVRLPAREGGSGGVHCGFGLNLIFDL